MKRILNFNFITIVILVGLLVLATGLAWVSLSEVSATVSNDIEELHDPNDDGEIDDVEGWGFIFGGSLLGLAALSVAFIKLVCVLGTGLFVLLVMVPAVIARLIYRAKKGRILVYRILMFFSYAGMSILAFFLGNIIFAGRLTVVTVVLSVLFLYTVAVLILGIRNTYTKRISSEQMINE